MEMSSIIWFRAEHKFLFNGESLYIKRLLQQPQLYRRFRRVVQYVIARNTFMLPSSNNILIRFKIHATLRKVIINTRRFQRKSSWEHSSDKILQARLRLITKVKTLTTLHAPYDWLAYRIHNKYPHLIINYSYTRIVCCGENSHFTNFSDPLKKHHQLISVYLLIQNGNNCKTLMFPLFRFLSSSCK